MTSRILSGAVHLDDDIVVVHLHPSDQVTLPWHLADEWRERDLQGYWAVRHDADDTITAVRVVRDVGQPPLAPAFVLQQLAMAAAFDPLDLTADVQTASAPLAATAQPEQAGRHRAAMVVPLVVSVLALLGLWLLPDLSPRADLPNLGYTQARAEILRTGLTDDAGQPAVDVRMLEGRDAGQVLRAAGQPTLAGAPGGLEMKPGDEVVVTQYSEAAGGFNTVGEVWRIPVLVVLLVAFAVFVSLVGGWQGVRSLVALALTLLMVVKVVLPLLLHGIDPIPLAVGAAAIVTVVTLTLTEGFRRTTLAASLGTLAALLLTAMIAALTTDAARFSAAQGSEEVSYLIPLLGNRLNLSALLLAATIFGALGVLDDVTVTQAAAVATLREADPASPRRRVFARAMHVGRAHIAATVNTLVLAYLGAGLPLLLLFAIGGDSPLIVANGELVAVEIVRSLAGSFGIVAAVPLTTAVAAFLLPKQELGATSRRGQGR